VIKKTIQGLSASEDDLTCPLSFIEDPYLPKHANATTENVPTLTHDIWF
jgi:hypothetical protein